MKNKIFGFGQGIVKWFVLLFSGLIGLTGLILYVEDVTWFEFFQIKVNILYTFGSLLCFSLIFIGVIKLIELKPKWKWKQIGLIVCSTLAIATLVTFPVTNWDQLWIQTAIYKLKGNMDVYKTITDSYIAQGFILDEYLNECPNLINNILYQSVFSNYLWFYGYNIILYLFTYDLGLKIIEDKAKYFGTLFCMCTPIAMYACFFYGEITAIFGITASIYLVKEIFKNNHTKRNLLLLFIVNFFMVWEKENMMVFVVAEVLTLILFLFKQDNKKAILGTLCMVILSTVLVSPTVSYVASLNGLNKGKSDPLSFIAMGMHDITEKYDYRQSVETGIEGGYDATNHKLTTQTEEEYLKAIEEDKEDIKTSLENFKENPRYAVKFYFNKIIKQWNSNDFNTSHFIRLNANELIKTLNKAIENGEHYIFIQPWYKTKLDYVKDFLCNGERMFIYLMTFILCVHIIRKKKELSYTETICLVMFIGNFLFSIIWEAKPRYCIYGYFTLLMFVSIQIEKYFEKYRQILK